MTEACFFSVLSQNSLPITWLKRIFQNFVLKFTAII